MQLAGGVNLIRSSYMVAVWSCRRLCRHVVVVAVVGVWWLTTVVSITSCSRQDAADPYADLRRVLHHRSWQDVVSITGRGRRLREPPPCAPSQAADATTIDMDLCPRLPMRRPSTTIFRPRLPLRRPHTRPIIDIGWRLLSSSSQSAM